MKVVFSVMGVMAGTMTCTMSMLFSMMDSAVCSMECQEDQPERIKWRKESNRCTHEPHQFSNAGMGSIGRPDDFVLTEKSGESGEACGTQCRADKYGIWIWHIFFLPAHFL